MKKIVAIALLITTCLATNRRAPRMLVSRTLTKFDRLNAELGDDKLTDFEKNIKTFDIMDAMMHPWEGLVSQIFEKNDLNQISRYLEAVLLKLQSLGIKSNNTKSFLMKNLAKSKYNHRLLKLVLDYCRPSDADVQAIKEVAIEDNSKVILGYVLDLYLRHYASPESIGKLFSVGKNPIRLCIRMHGSIPSEQHKPTVSCKEYCCLKTTLQEFTMICGDNFMALGDQCPVDQIIRVVDMLEDNEEGEIGDKVANFAISSQLNLVVAVQKKDQLHIVKCGTPTALVYTDISQDQIRIPDPLPADSMAISTSSSTINSSLNMSEFKYIFGAEARSYCTVQVHHKDLVLMVTNNIRAHVQTLDVTGVLQYSGIEERRSSCENLIQLFDQKMAPGDGAAFCMGSFLQQMQ